jgi:hypothetical protein
MGAGPLPRLQPEEVDPMMRQGLWTALLLGTVLLGQTSVALAQDTQPAAAADPAPNVTITLTVGDTEGKSGQSERSYRMVALSGGRTARLLMGWRMPIPTSQSVDENDPADPVISYVYQNIGMSADIEARVLEDGRIMLHGMIELSGSRDETPAEPAAGSPPIIGTFQQGLHVVVEDGKTLRVAEVPDPEGGNLYLEVHAEVMK